MGQISVNLSVLDWVSLFSAASSMVLAVISIWLALYFYKESKNAERETSSLLSKIGAQTDLLQKVTGKMLDKYVTYSTQPRQVDPVTQALLTQFVQNNSTQALTDNASVTDDSQVMQELTTLYIAVNYHSAVENAGLQNSLPATIQELEGDMRWLKDAMDASYLDFTVSKRWLETNGGDFIGTSPAVHYYEKMQESKAADIVFDTANFYMQNAGSEQV